MKRFIFVGLVGLAALVTHAYAETTPKVEITSFSAIEPSVSQHIAEVCGKVTGATSDRVILQVTADYSTSNPGRYNTFALKDGSFCQVINTIVGRVKVEIVGTKAAAAEAKF